MVLSCSSQVFCVHGGIPIPTLGDGLLSSIDDIPTHLPDPMDQSQLAWEIMWNDPIRYGIIYHCGLGIDCKSHVIVTHWSCDIQLRHQI